MEFFTGDKLGQPAVERIVHRFSIFRLNVNGPHSNFSDSNAKNGHIGQLSNPTPTRHLGQPSNNRCQIPSQIAFPESDYVNTTPPEYAINAYVPGAVDCNFCAPESRIGPRDVPAARAAVPEAAIHKDGNLFARKVQVRTTGDLFNVQPESSYTATDERHAYSQLRCFIALATDGPHLATASFGYTTKTI